MDDVLYEFNDKSLRKYTMKKTSERGRTNLLLTKLILTNVRIFIIILISTKNYQFLPPKSMNYRILDPICYKKLLLK